MNFKSISGSVLGAIVTMQAMSVAPAAAQLIPEVWVSGGSQDSTFTYSAGIKAFDLGVEIGKGSRDRSGVDVLKFISLPGLSPYGGLGLYGGELTYTGGIHFAPGGNTFYGVGYHSVRGINGQIGIRF